MFKKNSVILIVDDSRPSLDQMRADLLQLGFPNVIEAENGLKGILRIGTAEKSGAPVSLVISDWNMPVMGGLEFLNKVRSTEYLGHLPFIVVTSNTDIHEVVKAIDAGVSSYLLKPYDLNSLRESLENVYKRRKSKF